MTGFEANPGRERRLKSHAFGAAPLLCLVLLALLAVVQVAHIDPLGSDTDKCPLCVMLHSAAPVAAAATVIALVSFGAPTPVVGRRAVIRLPHAKPFTRPPPAGC